LFNRARYQFGSFRQKKRAKGPNAWEFRYYEIVDGVRRRSHMTLGTVAEHPTETSVRKAARGFLLKLNSEAPSTVVPRFEAVIDRFVTEEFPERHSTRMSYRSNVEGYIRPKWKDYPLDNVKAAAVEQWLKQLALAPKRLEPIFGVSCIQCLRRHNDGNWLIWGRTSISLVRVKGGSKRASRPQILTNEQFYDVLELIPAKYRLMVLVAQCLGLRVSEMVGLKWEDFDFDAGTVLVQRSVVHGRVDSVKTEYSNDLMPLASALAALILEWRESALTEGRSEWVFQNPVTGRPYHQESIQKRFLKPAGEEAGLGFSVGWNTFRHTHRAWLDDTGAPMTVQQQLMRHASIQTTMNVYGSSMPNTKREANRKIVQMVLGEPKKPTGTG
jgi:integrase